MNSKQTDNTPRQKKITSGKWSITHGDYIRSKEDVHSRSYDNINVKKRRLKFAAIIIGSLLIVAVYVMLLIFVSHI